MKGYLLRSMRDTQKELKLTTEDIQKLAPQVQTQVFSSSFDFLHRRLKFTLRSQDED